MIFNTWTFAIFGLLTWAAYWSLPRPRLRAYLLVVAGIVFYSFSVPAYLALIAVLGLLTFSVGQGLLRAENERHRSVLLIIGVSLIALTLGFFKYLHFFADTVNQIATRDILPIPTLIVPLAISFFTFEFVHVLVDVKLYKIRSLDALDFAVFTLFFPTLVAGPIKRYQSFVPQLHELQIPDPERQLGNAYRIILGLFKKVVLADSLTLLTQPLLAPGIPYHRLDYWVAFFAYSSKIYFDFTGYSDIAIGIAGMLALKVPENFDRPYRSANIQIFWRRWHISLSSWIRDYIFIPLGGSKRPPTIVVLNLFLAMTLAGLWHGAAWTFVIWGLWHGVGLAVQRIWATAAVPRLRILRDGGPFVTALSIATTYMFVTVGWVVFAAPSMNVAAQVVRLMFSPVREINK